MRSFYAEIVCSRILKRPSINRLPGNRGLGFGPSDLGLKTSSATLVEGESVNYALAVDRPFQGNGKLARPVPLGWTIEVRITPVNRLGHSLGRSRQRHWMFGQLRFPERSFGLRGVMRGLYRVTILFRDRSGSKLGTFRQFVQILPSRERLTIDIRNDTDYSPGQTVVGRIENHGTTEVSLPLGPGLSVEHFAGERWVSMVGAEPPSIMFEDPEFLRGGWSARCSYFVVPANAVPGLYRLTGTVESRASVSGSCT